MVTLHTQRADRVIRQAKEQAQVNGHPFATSGHLLLGIALVRDPLVTRAFEDVSLSASILRDRLVLMHGRGHWLPDPVELDNEAEQVYADALYRAQRQGSRKLRFEHLLTAALQSDEGMVFVGPPPVQYAFLEAIKHRRRGARVAKVAA